MKKYAPKSNGNVKPAKGDSTVTSVPKTKSGRVSVYLSPVEVNLIMSEVTRREFKSEFPRELIILMMQIYHSLRKVRLILGTGIQDESLFIIDSTTGAWVSLPNNSNGYVIHSPDAKMVTAWCGSPDTNYKHPVLRIPSGEEVDCVNDKKWETVKSKFQTWKYWQDKDGVLVFSMSNGDDAFAPSTKTRPDTYRVTIDCTHTPALWRYVSHGGEVPIPHDGINPCSDRVVHADNDYHSF